MKHIMQTDTIAAVATPMGEGGVAIVRISGEDTRRILERVFSPREFAPNVLYYGKVTDGKKTIDTGYAVFFAAPHSYTGEDSAELQVHGSALGAAQTLAATFAAGARAAQPGEFTKRAFLNGKLDLTQAEAVADFIGAKNDAALQSAQKHLSGGLKEKIQSFEDSLRDIRAEIEACVEYPEEFEEEDLRGQIINGLRALQAQCENLLDTFKTGRMLRSGASVVLCGNPNAGKSSVMNALLGYDRSIVSDIAGTTRDTVERTAAIEGTAVTLTDTAGVRGAGDELERLGAQRSLDAIKAADLVLLVEDASRPEERVHPNIANALAACAAPVVRLLNKTDIAEPTQSAEENGVRAAKTLRISAKTGEGLGDLKAAIRDILGTEDAAGQIVLTNARHAQLLADANAQIGEALFAVSEGVDLDVINTVDLAGVHQSFAELTGENISEQIVDRIFSKFCLGK